MSTKPKNKLHVSKHVSLLYKLFYFGLGIKRWLLLGLIGIMICSLGIAFIIKNIFDFDMPEFLPWHWEGVIVAVIGLTSIGLAVIGLYRSVSPILFSSLGIDQVTNTVYVRRARSKGPKIVALGGGTGLSVALKGLKIYSDNLSAIVSVGDDGGSSGILREQLGVIPPGDFRNCLVALAEDESLVGKLFQYRFSQGEGLQGHSFGNLFIAAMANITGGFDRALIESSKVLSVNGNILPSTLSPIELIAELENGSKLRGESKIGETDGSINRLSIDPVEVKAYPKSVDALYNAELIVLGPGSLYTSVLPSLLVPEISDAIKKSNAYKIYICNVATQPGETSNYGINEHVNALVDHTAERFVDCVIANNSIIDNDATDISNIPSGPSRVNGINVVYGDILDVENKYRHEPNSLADLIIKVYHGSR
ncbi:MAG: hypothetical protein CL768_01990 [Chloroflexi bacterium]|nr:hypothetical protein [Chloroflexota bacterium]